MSRRVGGGALLALAALMLFGFTRSSLSLATPSVVVALLLTVVAPAAAGVRLLVRRGAGGDRVRALRQQALESEILRLAALHQGRLTATEVATELALSPEEARATLDALVTREVADLAMTERGVLVYTFHEARHMGGKHEARGLLDA